MLCIKDASVGYVDQTSYTGYTNDSLIFKEKLFIFESHNVMIRHHLFYHLLNHINEKFMN